LRRPPPSPLFPYTTLFRSIQVPGVDSVVTNFLEPTFAGSRFASIAPSTADAWLGLGVGAVISIAGIAVAYLCWVARPGTTARLRSEEHTSELQSLRHLVCR